MHQQNHDQVEDIAMKTHLAKISLKRKAEISSGNVKIFKYSMKWVIVNKCFWEIVIMVSLFQ